MDKFIQTKFKETEIGTIPEEWEVGGFRLMVLKI